jgi:hypothetical protein
VNEKELKAYALSQLQVRRDHPPEHIRNETLHAGSAMYFYCEICGWLADLMPEGFISRPRHVCTECQFLKDQGWIGGNHAEAAKRHG